MMKCFMCPRTLDNGPLYRYNEKGLDPIWACEEHSKQPIDPELKEISDIIHDGGPKTETAAPAPAEPSESNLVRHAKMELAKQLQDPTSYDGMIAVAVVDLIKVFAEQGHSGMSAPCAVNTFALLAMYKPLGPLTGADDEWNDVGLFDGIAVYQNKRCSHVFKQADRFNGQAYDMQGRVFRDPDGSCWTNADSCVPITFPYTPKTEYVDRPAEISPEKAAAILLSVDKMTGDGA